MKSIISELKALLFFPFQKQCFAWIVHGSVWASIFISCLQWKSCTYMREIPLEDSQEQFLDFQGRLHDNDRQFLWARNLTPSCSPGDGLMTAHCPCGYICPECGWAYRELTAPKCCHFQNGMLLYYIWPGMYRSFLWFYIENMWATFTKDSLILQNRCVHNKIKQKNTIDRSNLADTRQRGLYKVMFSIGLLCWDYLHDLKKNVRENVRVCWTIFCIVSLK